MVISSDVSYYGTEKYLVCTGYVTDLHLKIRLVPRQSTVMRLQVNNGILVINEMESVTRITVSVATMVNSPVGSKEGKNKREKTPEITLES